jgi:hypothetical protein
MRLALTARSVRQDGVDYLGLKEQGLSATEESSEGNGAAENPFKLLITLRNDNPLRWSGIIHVELVFPKNEPRFFLPAFMYGRNRGEAPHNVPNEFPRLREGRPQRPSSSWWMVRADRLSHPVALAYDGGRVHGISASPYFIVSNGKKIQWKPGLTGDFFQYCGYSCSLAKGSLGYSLGFENAPWHFIQSHRVLERAGLGENAFSLEPGETLEFELKAYDYPGVSEQSVNAAIQDAYRDFHQSPRAGRSVRETVADLSRAVHRDAWMEDEKAYAGQVFEDAAAGGYRYNKITSISWTNGLAAAMPLLMAALRTGDEPMRERALSCIDDILAHSMNPSTGLPYTNRENGRWSNHGWWFDGQHTPGHPAYLVGQAVFYVLKAYEHESRIKGVKRGDWLAYAKAVLERVEGTTNAEGEFPYIFSEKTGAGIEYDSFGGAWCMAALAYYSWLTGDRSRLESLAASEEHYHGAYVTRMECYGAPLDTDKAVDSEGILAYLKALRYLHALSPEQKYLDRMKDALNYEFSFRFCYNSPIQSPPLSRLGWSSSGGTVTSTANPHIHPMGCNLIDEMLYYVGKTGDAYAEERMLDAVAWGRQTYNTFDREYDFGKKGWMSERFCYSEGLLTERYPGGLPASTWFCLMPWASACVIEGLAGDYWDIAEKRA